MAEGSRIARPVVSRFVAGSQIRDGARVAAELASSGLLATVAWVGEAAPDQASAERTRGVYLDLISALSRQPSGRNADVSVKLSALGLRVPDGGQVLALDHVSEICQAGQEHSVSVTIDMEDHLDVDATLSIVRHLRPRFPDLGCVLQANLRRTEHDCQVMGSPGARVRLCKGAYAPPANIAFHDRSEIQASYLRCLKRLESQGSYVMLATHDAEMMNSAARLPLGEESREFQMLLGVRRSEQNRLVASGHKVRVYVPFGDEWYPYLVRRLAERPSNLLLLARR